MINRGLSLISEEENTNVLKIEKYCNIKQIRIDYFKINFNIVFKI